MLASRNAGWARGQTEGFLLAPIGVPDPVTVYAINYKPNPDTCNKDQVTVMDTLFDTVILSRLQFALTAMFHILWPVLTIGPPGEARAMVERLRLGAHAEVTRPDEVAAALSRLRTLRVRSS